MIAPFHCGQPIYVFPHFLFENLLLGLLDILTDGQVNLHLLIDEFSSLHFHLDFVVCFIYGLTRIE